MEKERQEVLDIVRRYVKTWTVTVWFHEET